MNALNCQSCGQALALLDEKCGACQAQVPAEQRLQVLLPRAEGMAEQGRWADAARALDPLLALRLSPEEAKPLLRKKAAWLRKAEPDFRQNREQNLDSAEAALGEALRLDDGDAFSHQLWIDLLVERGLGEKAAAWYKQRLQIDPADAVAKKQLTVLNLASDFKMQPAPKVAIAPLYEPKGFIGRLLAPTKTKVLLFLAGGLYSTVQMLWILIKGPTPVDSALADLEGIQAVDSAASMLSLMNDPWMHAFSAALSFAYVAWGRKSIRG